MINILITGGAGNVGGALAQALVKNSNYFVVVADNFLTGSSEKLPKSHTGNFKFFNCDVNKLEEISKIFDQISFDFVFHYAALVGVKRTLDNPLDVLNDIEGVKNILSLCKQSKVKRVFFSSSSEVYGEPVEFPQNEHTTPLNSRLPYAIVKNVAEAFLKSYQRVHGLEFTIFRFFNTYGPNQSPDFVVSKFLNLALKGENISIYGNGSQTRTFCYIDDNIDATVRIFENNLYINDIVNIGNDIEIPVLDLAKLIINITKSESKITHLPALAEGDMTRRQPDNTKMKSILNRDLITIEEGIRKMLVAFEK
jgi:nucleoside-diphosphate-sugar epimerase